MTIFGVCLHIVAGSKSLPAFFIPPTARYISRRGLSIVAEPKRARPEAPLWADGTRLSYAADHGEGSERQACPHPEGEHSSL